MCENKSQKGEKGKMERSFSISVRPKRACYRAGQDPAA